MPGSKRPNIPKTTAQEIDILSQKILYLEGVLAELNDEVGKNKDKADFNLAAMLEKIGACRDGLKDLQSLLYGDPRFLITGLASEIKSLRATLDIMQDNEEARTNQIAGMKKAVYIFTAIASLPSLGYILPALGKLLDIL